MSYSPNVENSNFAMKRKRIYEKHSSIKHIQSEEKRNLNSINFDNCRFSSKVFWILWAFDTNTNWQHSWGKKDFKFYISQFRVQRLKRERERKILWESIGYRSVNVEQKRYWFLNVATLLLVCYHWFPKLNWHLMATRE